MADILVTFSNAHLDNNFCILIPIALNFNLDF